MFTELMEYEVALEKIVTKTNLSESQTNILLNLINKNPEIGATELIEIATHLDKGEKYIFDGSYGYSLEPILNESLSVNLMEITVPLIMKHIPEEVIGYLTEKHAQSIVEKILTVEFDPSTDSALELKNRIDEMFSAGDISIPVQGLRKQPNSIEVVMNGVFAPMLYKNIQFDKKFYNKPQVSHCKNKSTLKSVLKDYQMTDDETPLMKLLPKYVMVLKNLLGNEK